MDDNIVKLVNSKIQKLLEGIDSERFLSFSIDSRYTISPELITLLCKDEEANASSSYDMLCEFSRRMNRPIRGKQILMESDGEYLWDIYREVLNTAEIAESTLSVDEESFTKAKKFLYTIDKETGIPVKTEKHQQYANFVGKISALESEEQNLNFRKNSGENVDAEINALREQLKNLKAELASNSNYTKVEAYIRDYNAYLASNPISVWKELKKKYLEDVEYLTDIQSSAQYSPTFLSPRGILKQKWTNISFNKEELEKAFPQEKDASTANQRVTLRRLALPHHTYRLGRKLPSLNAKTEVKKELSVRGGHLGTSKEISLKDTSNKSIDEKEIKSFSFEYTIADVVRSWMDTSVFEWRNWRLSSTYTQGAISDGNGNGRLPSYISSLVFARNFKVKFSDGTEESLDVEEENDVTIWAYICTSVPKCPNPEPNAKWLSDTEYANVEVIGSEANNVTIRYNGLVLASGLHKVGQMLEFHTNTRVGYVLSKWLVNNEPIPDNNYSCEVAVQKHGLKVQPIWEIAKDDSNFTCEVTKDGELVSIKKGPETLDMNIYGKLCNVRSIASHAFDGYDNLYSIILGSRVSCVGEEAFSKCPKLERVEIPAATTSIDESAFSNTKNDILFNVSSKNERYTTIDGVLIEKCETLECKILRCSCGAVYLFDNVAPAKCPKCQSDIEASKSKLSVIRKPTQKVAFKVDRDVALQSVKRYYGAKSFINKEFSDALLSSDLILYSNYQPHWEWEIQAESELNVVKTIKEKVKLDDGTLKEESRTESSTKIVSTPGMSVAVSATSSGSVQKMESKPFIAFSFDDVPDNTTFQLYSKNVKDSLSQARRQVEENLLEKERQGQNSFAVSLTTNKTRFLSEKSKLVMLPIWEGRFEYEGKKYGITVDGYSGEIISGDYKKDTKKIIKTVGIVIGVILAIVLSILFCFKLFS